MHHNPSRYSGTDLVFNSSLGLYPVERVKLFYELNALRYMEHLEFEIARPWYKAYIKERDPTGFNLEPELSYSQYKVMKANEIFQKLRLKADENFSV